MEEEEEAEERREMEKMSDVEEVVVRSRTYSVGSMHRRLVPDDGVIQI